MSDAPTTPSPLTPNQIERARHYWNYGPRAEIHPLLVALVNLTCSDDREMRRAASHVCIVLAQEYKDALLSSGLLKAAPETLPANSCPPRRCDSAGIGGEVASLSSVEPTPPADDVVDLTLALELVDIQDEDGMHKLVQASCTQSLAKQVIALAEKLKVRAATPSPRVTREALARVLGTFTVADYKDHDDLWAEDWAAVQTMKYPPTWLQMADAIAAAFPGLVEDTTP